MIFFEKEKGKTFNFLSSLFGNKDFISQESPMLADVENIMFYWIRIIDLLLRDNIYQSSDNFWKCQKSRNPQNPGVK